MKVKADYQPGTHLTVNFGMYRHHGIALGDHQVIHFGRGIFDMKNAVIEQVDLESFSQGREITVMDSELGFELTEVVTRAHSRLGERGYHLLHNNCEHFANWCRHGDSASEQVRAVGMAAQKTLVALSVPLVKTLFKRTAFKGVVGTVARGSVIGIGVVAVYHAGSAIAAMRR